MRKSPPFRHARPIRQQGAVLMEALVAILIFSFGILGIVGMQATAIQQSSDARYRADAALLVEQLIGEMWVGDRAVANLQTLYNTCSSSSCTGYQGWYGRVAATLPGVATVGATRPTISVDAAGLVTVSVFWRAPNENPADPPHVYSSTAQIRQ